MKKVIAGIFASLLIAGNSHAQLFVGGDLGVSTSGGKIEATTTTDKPSSFSLSLNPMVGYFLSDNMAAGVELTIGTQSTKITSPVTITSNTTTLGIAPFVRYYFVQLDKVGLFAHASVGFQNKHDVGKNAGTVTAEKKTGTIYAAVLPAVSYKLSDKIELEAFFNLFSLSISREAEKTIQPTPEVTDITSSFNMGFGTSSLFTTGAITVGAIYRF